MYWKDRHGNEYGPFDQQEDGFPHAGQVMARYRLLKGLTPKKLAELWGGTTARWIQRMEKENLVPETLSRRRALARILEIPPILLGLASMGDFLQEAPKTIPMMRVDLASHKADLKIYWNSHFTSTAKHSLPHLYGKVAQLHGVARDIGGSGQTELIETLAAYHRLIARVSRDQRDFPTALDQITTSLDLAEHTQNQKLIAAAYLTKGRTLFEQGSQTSAIENMEVALSHVKGWGTPLEATILLELAIARAYTTTTEADRKQTHYLLDSAEALVQRKVLEDDESFTGLSMGMFHTHRSDILIALGKKFDAADALDDATSSIAPDQTRRLAYIDILQARLALQTGEPLVALSLAEKALMVSTAIGSEYNLACLDDIYARLRMVVKPRDIAEFGRALASRKGR